MLILQNLYIGERAFGKFEVALCSSSILAFHIEEAYSFSTQNSNGIETVPSQEHGGHGKVIEFYSTRDDLLRNKNRSHSSDVVTRVEDT